jgi:chromosome segregation ATPase
MQEVSEKMSDIIELLESELEEAFEVKDKKSLHRYVVLMVDRFAAREAEEERESETRRSIDALRGDVETGFSEVKGDVREVVGAMREGFERMDERFVAVQEQMDQRFESLQREMDQRFEAVDKRFEDMNKRFEVVDRRFEDMNRRFEAVDKRFEDMNKRFTNMVTLMSVFFTVLVGLIAALRIFG